MAGLLGFQTKILTFCPSIKVSRAWHGPKAAGCLLCANPSAPEAGLLGHVGMNAATGCHAAHGPGSNPQLGTSISIRMNMSISSDGVGRQNMKTDVDGRKGRGGTNQLE